MAAASLGQVHRARFRGRLVAVKVQYPGVVDALLADVENLGSVVRAVRRATVVLDGREYFDEMRAALVGELDYVREADQCELVRSAARGFPELVVPEVVRERSSRRVLTLELLAGPTLGEVLRNPPEAVERFRISRLLIRAIFGPFLAAGVVHADPHPGNYVILPDGRFGILDFGAVKKFSPEVREGARELLRAGLGGERIDVVTLCRRMGFRIDLPDREAEELIRAVLEIGAEPLRTRDYDYAGSSTVFDVKRRLAKNPARALKIRPPPQLVLLARAAGGLTLDLRQLRARGNFRAVYEELAALS
jgi:predicted unusual protein kinase regulating ubiquinone biosynthesis (AarF/ABC1/UbiB family)